MVNFMSVARLLLCIAVAGGLTATLVYLYRRKEEEDEESDSDLGSNGAIFYVKIPNKSVGYVIGRGGANIKRIAEKTNTRIEFKEDVEGRSFTLCLIKGERTATAVAESMIHDLLVNQPLIETSEMLVPQKACGRVIGLNEDTVKEFCRVSNVRIYVEPPFNTPLRKITIKGTAEQIVMAKSWIQEKIDQDEQTRRELKMSLANRTPRRKDRQYFLTAGEDTNGVSAEGHPSERLAATGSDGLMEVYVSSVHSPDRFWVQVIGPRAVELDHLVDQMTEYYSKDENKEIHTVKELRVGSVVAAPFSFDEKWYRAEVTSVIEDEYDTQESKVSLYYVDYGDSDEFKKKELLELKTDFLQLRSQAIECCLAKVRPRGGEWSPAAIDFFQELTHAAQWVVIMARIDSYKEKDSAKRGGSSVPCVDLYDPQDSKDVSISKELVKHGFADWAKCEKNSPDKGEPFAAKTVRYPIDDSSEEYSDELEMF